MEDATELRRAGVEQFARNGASESVRDYTAWLTVALCEAAIDRRKPGCYAGATRIRRGSSTPVPTDAAAVELEHGSATGAFAWRFRLRAGDIPPVTIARKPPVPGPSSLS